MKLTGSDLINRALRAEGIEKVFAIAGDHTLPLMDLMSIRGFDFIDTRHEQAAVDMANAWGRITGIPGVTLFTTPGQANAIPGLTLAHHMESPIINIVGSAPQDRLGQGAMQEIDQVGMARPVTKGSWMISDPYRIPEYFARAFRVALSGRRGPVHLTVPLDVQEAEIDEHRVRFFEPREYRHLGQIMGDLNSIKSAIELLNSANTPMIIASSGAFSTTEESLSRLIEITGIPVFTEDSARGIVSDIHPNCFGFADSRVSNAATFLKEADAVLLLGKKLDFTINFGNPPNFRSDVKLIQVEPDSNLIGLSRGVDVVIQGDVGAIVNQLGAEAETYKWQKHPMVEEISSEHKNQIAHLEAQADSKTPIHAMSVHKALSDVLDEDSCLVFEGSDFAFYGAAYHPAYKANRWFTNGTLGMIGWGVPFGFGAKVASPTSKVVVLTGDGAFGFSAMEIDTAVRHNIPVVIVMGNDSVWGIDYHQQMQLYGRSVATTLLPTRYDKMAEALGAHGEYVSDVEQLPGALSRAFAVHGPSLVMVQTRPSPSPLTEFILKAKGGST